MARYLPNAVPGPHDHVGEMAAIEPSQARTATVITAADSLICKRTEPQLAEIGQRHGGIWRSLARELVRRLAQRNMFVPPSRQHIHLFILSSSEALPIAHEIQNTFAHDNFSVVICSDGVFTASAYPIESLEQAVDASDFALAIAQPGDFITSRGHTIAVPRDNVIFELGLFIGRLGRKRTFLLEPRGDNGKLPSDLSGLITIPYRPGKPHELPSLLRPACHHIRKIINEFGPRP
jgi:CRP/FNR family transcriptional regulator, cyclic AMP receptor protein